MRDPKLNKKVYLITRNPERFSKLQDIVRNSGHHFVYDDLGDNYVEKIRSFKPDIIFIDRQVIASHNGRLLDHLKENTKNISTPIFILDSESAKNGMLIDKIESEFDTVDNHKDSFKTEDIFQLIDGISKKGIDIKFWGVRGSTPCANRENIVYGGNTTCVQIKVPGSDNYLILDSGTGIRNLGNYITEHKKQVKGRIFITHPHWDHIQGFPFFKPIYTPENHFDIHMPPQINGGCREILSGHLTKNFFPITLEMIDANLEFYTQSSELQQYEGYKVEYMLANHPINTAIYKIHINGTKIVFAPDNELTPVTEKTNPYFYNRFSEFLKDVDLLIHDAQFNRESYQQKVGWGHSTWEDVVEFAIQTNIKQLILTHHDPDSDDNYLELLDKVLNRDFSKLFKTIQLAKEGTRISLPAETKVS